MSTIWDEIEGLTAHYFEPDPREKLESVLDADMKGIDQLMTLGDALDDVLGIKPVSREISLEERIKQIEKTKIDPVTKTDFTDPRYTARYSFLNSQGQLELGESRGERIINNFKTALEINKATRAHVPPRMYWRGWKEKIGKLTGRQYFDIEDNTIAKRIPFIGYIAQILRNISSKKLIEELRSFSPEALNTVEGQSRYELLMAQVKDILERAEFLDYVGVSTWGKVQKTLVDMLPYMIEFLATSGVASAAGKSAQTTATALAGKFLPQRAAAVVGKTAQWMGSAAARMPTMGTGMALARATELMVPGAQITPKGVEITEEGKPFGEALWKGIANAYFELLGEEAGEFVPGIGKLLGGRKLWKAVRGPLLQRWLRTQKGSVADFIRLLRKAGYHGVINELGEEAFTDFLNAVTNTGEFGLSPEQNTVFNRTMEALWPGWEEMKVRAISFAIPGAATTGLSTAQYGVKKGLHKYAENAYARKQIERMLTSKVGISNFIEQFPAEARWLATHPEASRSEFEAVLGNPGLRLSKEQRRQIAFRIYEALRQREEEKKHEQEEQFIQRTLATEQEQLAARIAEVEKEIDKQVAKQIEELRRRRPSLQFVGEAIELADVGDVIGSDKAGYYEVLEKNIDERNLVVERRAKALGGQLLKVDDRWWIVRTIEPPKQKISEIPPISPEEDELIRTAFEEEEPIVAILKELAPFWLKGESREKWARGEITDDEAVQQYLRRFPVPFGAQAAQEQAYNDLIESLEAARRQANKALTASQPAQTSYLAPLQTSVAPPATSILPSDVVQELPAESPPLPQATEKEEEKEQKEEIEKIEEEQLQREKEQKEEIEKIEEEQLQQEKEQEKEEKEQQAKEIEIKQEAQESDIDITQMTEEKFENFLIQQMEQQEGEIKPDFEELYREYVSLLRSADSIRNKTSEEYKEKIARIREIEDIVSPFQKEWDDFIQRKKSSRLAPEVEKRISDAERRLEQMGLAIGDTVVYGEPGPGALRGIISIDRSGTLYVRAEDGKTYAFNAYWRKEEPPDAQGTTSSTGPHGEPPGTEGRPEEGVRVRDTEQDKEALPTEEKEGLERTVSTVSEEDVHGRIKRQIQESGVEGVGAAGRTIYSAPGERPEHDVRPTGATGAISPVQRGGGATRKPVLSPEPRRMETDKEGDVGNKRQFGREIPAETTSARTHERARHGENIRHARMGIAPGGDNIVGHTLDQIISRVGRQIEKTHGLAAPEHMPTDAELRRSVARAVAKAVTQNITNFADFIKALLQNPDYGLEKVRRSAKTLEQAWNILSQFSKGKIQPSTPVEDILRTLNFKPPAPEEIRTDEDNIFTDYRIQKANTSIFQKQAEGAPRHPANLVESSTMAYIAPPDITYKHHLPKELIASGNISQEQIESVIYAGQTHQTILLDGTRAAFSLNDGTGVGKTRQFLGILWDNFAQGRKKALVISPSKDLFTDLQREAEIIGFPMEIFSQSAINVKDKINKKEGVLFTTYRLIARDWDESNAEKKSQRYAQLLEYLGPDFDGVIVFDESHQMQNAIMPRGGTQQIGTNTGRFGIAIQERYPLSRVVFSSATPATLPQHMGVYRRLGLWGPGTPWADYDSFVNTMVSGGMGMMELLAANLKAMGRYIARLISYRGPTLEQTVELRPLEIPPSPEFVASYNRAAQFWQKLMKEFMDALARTNPNKREQVFLRAHFYATQQRFFLQLMMAAKVKHLIAAIKKDLANNMSVLVSLVNTGEAQTRRQVMEAKALGLPLEEVDMTPREIVKNLIENAFPTDQYVYTAGPSGQTKLVQAGKNRESMQIKEQLLEELANIHLPPNALDTLIQEFGTDMVAEITGRKKRIVLREGKLVEENRYQKATMKGYGANKVNIWERDQFMAGKKRIAIFSGAGGMGISLHADKKALNKQRRVYYTLQVPWSATMTMQMLGRGHRAGQVSAPIFSPVMIGIAGEKRLWTATSRRLSAMGALTRGGREAMAGKMIAVEDVTDIYGQQALRSTYDAILNGELDNIGLTKDILEIMGILSYGRSHSLGVNEAHKTDVDTFLNRIMVLDIDKQNKLFDQFYERYRANVLTAQEVGDFDFGVGEIKARNLRYANDPVLLHRDKHSGAIAEYYELEGQVATRRDTWDFAASWASSGFCRNTISGNIYAVRLSATGVDYVLRNPRGEIRYIKQEDFAKKYSRLSNAEARVLWQREYAKIPPTETRKFHLISGAIIPIWDIVMAAGRMPKIRISRANVEGKPIIGLEFPPEAVPQLKQRLGLLPSLAELPVDAIIEILNGHGIIELDNGWRISQITLHGEPVYRLNPQGQTVSQQEIRMYGWQDEITRNTRFWFTTLKNAKDVIGRTLQQHKAVVDITVPEIQGKAGAKVAPRQEAITNPDESHGLAIPTQDEMYNPATGTIDKMSLPNPNSPLSILLKAEQLFDIPMHTAAIHYKRSGEYSGHFHSIRFKRQFWTDLEVMGHEIGEHIWHTSKIRNAISDAALHELQGLDYNKERRNANEGFAEFLRLWLTGMLPEDITRGFPQKDIRIVAPQFLMFFERWLEENDDMREKLLELRGYIRHWFASSAMQRVQKQISRSGKINKPAGMSPYQIFRQEFINTADWLYMQFKDYLWPIRQMEKEARKRGFIGKPGQGAYAQAMFFNQLGLRLAQDALIGDGVWSIPSDPLRQPAKLSNSLANILQDISPEEYDDFGAYLVARQALEIFKKARGKIYPGISEHDAEKTLNELNEKYGSRFRNAAISFTEYGNALLEMMMRVGLITEKERAAMVNMWEDHAPLWRVREERFTQRMLRRATSRQGPAFANLPRPLKRRFGSGAPIINPIYAQIMRTTQFYERAARQAIINGLYNMLQNVEGLGGWMDPVPPTMKATHFYVGEIADQLQAVWGKDFFEMLEKAGIDKEQAAMTALHIFRPDYYSQTFGGKPVVRVIIDGKPKLFHVDPYLLEVLTAASHYSLPAWADVVFGKPARLMKIGLTGLNLAFGGRNIIKDYWTFLAQTEEHQVMKGKISGVWAPFAGMVQFAVSLAKKMMNKEPNAVVELWEKYGGMMATPVASDIKSMQKELAKLGKSPLRKMLNIPLHPIDSLRMLIGITEAGPRVAEFAGVMQRYGYTPQRLREMIRKNERPPLYVLVEAINAANDVTVNFKRQGLQMRWLNQIIPFLNANIEGVDKAIRTGVMRPGQIAGWVATIVMAQTIYWLIRKDDDDYSEQPDWLKYGFWTIPLNEDDVIRIPRGYNWFFVVSAFVEGVLEAWAKDKPSDLNKAITEIAMQLRPPLLPGAVSPMLEVVSNWQFFYRRPIEPEWALQVKPEDRYFEYTAEMSKQIGKALRTSPLMIEYLLNAYTGGMYLRFIQGIETVFRPETFESSRLPLAGGVMVRGTPSRSIDEYYKQLNKATQEYGSAKKNNTLTPEIEYKRYFFGKTSPWIQELREIARKETNPHKRNQINRLAIGIARHATRAKPVSLYPWPFSEKLSAIDPKIEQWKEELLADMVYMATNDSLDDKQNQFLDWFFQATPLTRKEALALFHLACLRMSEPTKKGVRPRVRLMIDEQNEAYVKRRARVARRWR